jgi:predicted acyl esterase
VPVTDPTIAELHERLREATRGPLPPNTELLKDVYIPLRDGIRLCADVYRPSGSVKCPVILSIAPYIKELQQNPPLLTHSIEAGPTDALIESGYIHVIATHRGAGQSQGQYNHISATEQADLYDVVEWLAKQAWCDGNVGMIGDSHYAVNSLWAAVQQPPSLRCVIPYDAMSDFYRDFAYPGGVFKSRFLSIWYIDSTEQFQWPGPVDGRLPPANQLQDFIENPFDGPYWWERSLRTQLDRIKIPVLHIVPISPVHTRGQLWAYPRTNTNKKLVVTPVTHPNKGHWLFLLSEPLKAYMIQWLDHWMKGIDTPIVHEPEVAIFDPGLNEWRYENEYPLERTEWTNFYLSGNGAALPYGSLGKDKPTDPHSCDSYEIPDWPTVEAGRPVLAYQSNVLERPLKLWGPLSATVYASTTSTDTAWFVKVGDVAPDGKLTLLTNGVLKASMRELDPELSQPGRPFHRFTRRELPESGKIYEYQIEMRPLFHTLKKGHRLWCQIQSNDPVNINFLHTVYNTEMLPYPATNTIHHSLEYPSHLALPVIPDAPEIAPVSSPLKDVCWPIKGLAWDAH